MGTQKPTLTSPMTPASPQPVVHKGRSLIVAEEPGQPVRARVIGALTGDAVQVLLAAVDRGVALLDLSQVDDVDEAAVRALAGLLPRRCSLLACPRWLELWLGQVRWASRGVGRVA
jgi:hypothetical protein